jgi:AraC-like DNA-binding protein
VLPLGRFAVMRSGGCADAYESIRSRHPGVHGFTPRVPEAGWRINVNVLNLGRVNVIATQSSAFAVQNTGDALVRFYLPLSRSAEIRTSKRRQTMVQGAAVLGPSRESTTEFQDGFRGLIAAVPQAILSEALRCFSGEANLLQRIDVIFNKGASLDLARRQMLSLVRTIDDAPEQILHEQRFLRAHEELLVLHLAKALAEVSDADDVTRSAVYLARALDFIHAHVLDDIGPVAIASAAGCSLRNLQLLFAREFGQTISATLRRLRLQKARARLLSADPNVTITGVALDCGFSHLSDFARHYRQEFHENPSQTMLNARSHRV